MKTIEEKKERLEQLKNELADELNSWDYQVSTPLKWIQNHAESLRGLIDNKTIDSVDSSYDEGGQYIAGLKEALAELEEDYYNDGRINELSDEIDELESEIEEMENSEND